MTIFPHFFLFLSAASKMSHLSGSIAAAVATTTSEAVARDMEVCSESKAKQNIFDFHTRNITGKKNSILSKFPYSDLIFKIIM